MSLHGHQQSAVQPSFAASSSLQLIVTCSGRVGKAGGDRPGGEEDALADTPPKSLDSAGKALPVPKPAKKGA